jgi:hypothetical protein
VNERHRIPNPLTKLQFVALIKLATDNLEDK